MKLVLCSASPRRRELLERRHQVEQVLRPVAAEHHHVQIGLGGHLFQRDRHDLKFGFGLEQGAKTDQTQRIGFNNSNANLGFFGCGCFHMFILMPGA